MGSKVLAGRYELIEKIGDGGMAVVYKATDRLLNRNVAIKILKPEYTKDLKFIENFGRESQAAARLSHPNIVNIYDVGREGNINFIVMELIEGETLAARIQKNGALPPREAVAIARQIASALSCAHKHEIVHRDVKPHNILLTSDGTAKITDFGIAKSVDMGTIVGQAGMVMGSVHYFSPEQARGSYVDEKSDIYSLGIVMYEMLTGQVPFDADNPVAVAVMHMNQEMVPPRRLNPNIPPEVEAIVLKATDKYQVNRYHSALEMQEALERANLSTLGIYSGVSYAERKQAQEEYYSKAGEEGQGESLAPEASEVTPAESPETPGKNDKKGKGKSKKKVNKTVVLAIIAALVVAIPLSQLLVHAISGGFGGGSDIPVPDLVGKTMEEAEAELTEMGLSMEIGSEVYSTEQDAGCVVSQDPEEGNKVKKGFTVTVNISKGGKAGVIPDVEGLLLSDAKHIIESNGYEVGEIIEEESDTVDEGKVISQSPFKDKEAKEGTSIDLVVSLGSEATVPNLLGKTESQAKSLLEKEGLELGNVSKSASDEYGAKTICGQSPEAGKGAAAGDKVDIVISTGATNEPTSLSLRIDYEKATDEVFYVTVILVDANGNVSNIVDYQQRLKSDGGETVSLSGTGKATVKVLFNNDIVYQYNVDFDSGEISG